MAGTINERTLRMMNGFMSLHDQGKTIPEIAEIFELSETAVRQHLQEIADAHGVTRESLLQIVHCPHIMGARQFEPIVRIDTEKLRMTIREMETDLERFECNLSEQIIEHEKQIMEMEEE